MSHADRRYKAVTTTRVVTGALFNRCHIIAVAPRACNSRVIGDRRWQAMESRAISRDPALGEAATESVQGLLLGYSYKL